MKKELKTKEGIILNESQQTFQLMNIADSLDEIKKYLVSQKESNNPTMLLTMDESMDNGIQYELKIAKYKLYTMILFGIIISCILWVKL